MNQQTIDQIAFLNSDFEAQTGHSFDHFFCPILYSDEPKELAQGHIIPKSFCDSSKKTIVQRKDVDNFFGHFEAVFEQIQRADLTHEELLTNKNAGILKPKLMFDSVEIESYHYNPKTQVPDHHTLIGKMKSGAPVPWIVAKIVPEEFDALGDRLVSYIDADFRMAALISCLKVAHLTLFRLMGYQYVLNHAGFFLGRKVLGNYYDRAMNLQRGSNEFKSTTSDHFAKFKNLVRPVERFELPVDITGTISDKKLLVCWDENNRPWAAQILVRFGEHLNGVLVPSGESNYRKYNEMLNAESSLDLNVSIGRFGDKKVEVDSRRFEINWPKANWRCE